MPGLKKPTELDFEQLVDAMCCVLNDLAVGGNVCDLVQAHARLAFEPFRLDDSGELMDLADAKEIVQASIRPARESGMEGFD